MKTFELEATKRTSLTKSHNKQIRREGKVPAVVYGGGEPAHITVDKLRVGKLLSSPETYLVKVNDGGKPVDAIMREVQFHPVTDDVLHVDFLRVVEGNDMEIELPVKLVGKSPGVLAGGQLLKLIRKIRVYGKPEELPESIDVDISKLQLGKTIKVSDVALEGINITTPSGAGIAAVEIPRALKTADATEEEEAPVEEES